MKKKRLGNYLTPKEGFRQTLSIMRISVLLLFVFMNAATANVLSQAKVTIRKDAATYEEIFTQIKKQTGLTVVYSNNELNKNRSVAAQFVDADVESILKRILAGTNLGYELQDEFIVLRREAQQPQQPNRQSATVTGRVVDEKGNPLVGVTVMVVGTSTGTLTDKNGQYRISIPATGQAALHFSYLGRQSQDVPYAGKNVIDVTLKENVTKVENVVVTTGYANINKGDITGAVTVIDAEKIQVAGESSIDRMLQGVVPGMSVINTTGKVGGTPKIRIRGTSTILGNQEPLWVVDGVIQRDPLPRLDSSSPLYTEMAGLRETAANAISWLNPSDIQTITVLKDASVTAIYGSQASNGVIVITTKRAKDPGLSVSYSGNFSIGQKPGYQLYDQMNSQELMRFAQEVYMDRDSYRFDILPIGYGGLIKKLQNKEISRSEFERQFRIMENQNTDWFDMLFRNSFSQKHNVSVSGMGDKISSRFSMGFDQQSGGAKGGDDLQMFTASSNSTFRSSDRLIIDLFINGSYRETEDFAFGVKPYDYAMNTSRTIPMYNDDGTLFYHEKTGTTSNSIPGKTLYNYNILNEIDNTGVTNTSLSVNASLNARVKVTKDLEAQAMASYQVSSANMKAYATELSNYVSMIRGYEFGEVLPNSDAQHASILPFGGILNTQNALNNSYMLRASLIYNKHFNEDHRITAQFGFELNSSTAHGDAATRYGYLYYRGEGFASVPKTFTNISGASSSREDLHETMRKASNITSTKDNKLSEYFTLIYGFKERYVLNASARVDASNRFGQDQNKKFNPSWSLGVKWRIGNESFMKGTQRWLDMFDLAASYGYRGNAVQSVSPYMIAKDGGFSYDFQQYILLLKSLAYPNLGWERKNDWNLQLDFSFFRGRVAANLNLYGGTSNVLSSRDVPIENGVYNAQIEGTKMDNKGYDLDISVVPVRSKDITWSLSFNAGKARNTIRNNERINTRADYLGGSAIVNGQAYGTFYAYAFNGLDEVKGRPMFKNMDIDPTENDLDYLVKAGCLEPDFAGGFNTSLRYKNLRFNAAFAVSFGAQKFLPAVYADYGAPTPDKNAPRYLFNRWRKPGDEKLTNIPSIPPGNLNYADQVKLPTVNSASFSPYTLYNQSDIRVADSDFIRCRQLSLQYDLPAQFIQKIYAKRVSLSASLTNPFLIALDDKWEGKDPETGTWPARRTVSFSLGLTF